MQLRKNTACWYFWIADDACVVWRTWVPFCHAWRFAIRIAVNRATAP